MYALQTQNSELKIQNFRLEIHSKSRNASAFLNNSAPGFIVAAEPQATPQRTISEKFAPFFSDQTMPATIESPAPTVLNFLTVGAGIISSESRVTSIAPAGPSETTTT
jgi:hypothetical protein